MITRAKKPSVRDAAVKSTRAIRDGRRIVLEIPLIGEMVPAVLLLPTAKVRPPAALLLHGYGSRKEQMADSVGRTLLESGIASLSIDLPLHGERERSVELDAVRNPLVLVSQWRAALAECGAALEWMAEHDEVDGHRLAVVGYSMGSFIGVMVAARSDHAKALILAAGGDLPEGTPFTRLVRTVADPIRAVRRLEGRPLLMVHGTRDRTVRPEQAARLFEAAGEPKELRWYETGHWLPDAATRDAAVWLSERLQGPGARRQERR
ncbi:MAG: alpha/beta fold hydrolase [Gemmatimonadaceae bacterium]|nr:alpha/beta fold hydrolase [Gemmatimonadaceae bacterium]